MNPEATSLQHLFVSQKYSFPTKRTKFLGKMVDSQFEE
jgi:hypothetical protein